MWFECYSCGQPVRNFTGRMNGWEHLDGWPDCRPTYASPNFNKPLGSNV